MARIKLANLEQLKNFGQSIAQFIRAGGIKGIFLTGPLGCGKTTLVRTIVEALPGSENCEISSPSFTVYNRYPTYPPIIHCDLYKCQSNFPQEILDYWHDQNDILLLEWAEYFPPKFRMEPTWDISFIIEKDVKYLNLDENILSNLAK